MERELSDLLSLNREINTVLKSKEAEIAQIIESNSQKDDEISKLKLQVAEWQINVGLLSK
jgi:hypothetical protein